MNTPTVIAATAAFQVTTRPVPQRPSRRRWRGMRRLVAGTDGGNEMRPRPDQDLGDPAEGERDPMIAMDHASGVGPDDTIRPAAMAVATRNQAGGHEEAPGGEAVPLADRSSSAHGRVGCRGSPASRATRRRRRGRPRSIATRRRSGEEPTATSGGAAIMATSAMVVLRRGRIREPATVGARWTSVAATTQRDEPEHVQPRMGWLRPAPSPVTTGPTPATAVVARATPTADVGQGDGVGDRDDASPRPRAATEAGRRRPRDEAMPDDVASAAEGRRARASRVGDAERDGRGHRRPRGRWRRRGPAGSAGGTWPGRTVKNGRTAAIAVPAAPASRRCSAAHGLPPPRMAVTPIQSVARPTNAAAIRSPANVVRRSSARRMTRVGPAGDRGRCSSRGRGGSRLRGTGRAAGTCPVTTRRRRSAGSRAIGRSVQRVAVAGLEQAERAATDEVEGVGDDRVEAVLGAS